MAPGRPLKLTELLIKRICKLIAEGNYREVAAKGCNIHIATFCSWMARGRESDQGIFSELYEAVLKAEQDAEMAMVKLVVTAAKDDANHAKWWLERKVPRRWSKDRLQIKELEKRVVELEKKADALPDPSRQLPGNEPDTDADDGDDE